MGRVLPGKAPLRLRWTLRALARLDEIGATISVDNPDAANRVVSSIVARVLDLRALPNLGRTGRCAGTRELVIPDTPYIVAYKVEPEQIILLTILHSAQKWPRRL